MNLRIVISIEWEEAWGTWKAYRESIPKRAHNILCSGKYIYRKFRG